MDLHFSCLIILKQILSPKHKIYDNVLTFQFLNNIETDPFTQT